MRREAVAATRCEGMSGWQSSPRPQGKGAWGRGLLQFSELLLLRGACRCVGSALESHAGGAGAAAHQIK